jgi:hypothetical protein
MKDFLRSPFTRLWLPVLGLTAGRAWFDHRTDPGDLVYFVHRGEHLLSGGWASTFADPMLQSGPLQLVVFGAIRNLTVLAFVLELAVAALLLYVLGRLRVPERLRLVVGLLAVAAGLTQGAFIDGHPAEAIVPLLWVLAAVWVREGRTFQAGALVGLSAGLELWGILGVVVLLLAPRFRGAALGGVVAAVVVAAMLAPFAAFGSFRMFDHEWRVATGTVLSLVVEPGTAFGWPLRLLQSTLALATGAALAYVLRRSVHALWAVPLATVIVRLALDPLSFGWYFLEAEALVLVAAALLLRELPTRFPAARLLSGADRQRPEAVPPPAHS